MQPHRPFILRLSAAQNHNLADVARINFGYAEFGSTPVASVTLSPQSGEEGALTGQIGITSNAAGKVTGLRYSVDPADEHQLTRERLRVEGGTIAVPKAPGLGVEPDLDQIERAHALYCRIG
jgi:hypothetical protein